MDIFPLLFVLLLNWRELGADSQCQQQQFNELFASALSAYSNLENLTQHAEGKGIECTYERITLNATNLFLNYSLYDFNVTDVLCKEYRDQYGPEGCAEGEALPCRELNKTMVILSRATADVEKLLKTPSLYRRRTVPPHQMLGTMEKGSYLYRDDKPVFPGGYDHGDYAFYYGFPSDVVPQVKTVGQDSEEVVAHIATLLPTPDGVNTSEVHKVVDSFDRLYQLGLTSGLVLGCKLPEWVVTKYPDITRYMLSSCKYDIDHPAIGILWQQGLTPLIGKLKSHPALNSFRLGNEVFFRILGNDTVISSYTTKKWHTWLQNKYGTISALNKAWKSSHSDFSQVFFPGKTNKNSGKIEVDSSFFGTAQWYDFCRFNADRVLDYYTWFTGLIQQLDPEARTHVKYVNEHLFQAIMDNGLDRYALNKLTNWSGCDTRIMPAPVDLIKTQFRNSGQYALDWLNTAISYTWMRSTAPHKLVVDLEVHPITISKYRNGSVPDNHMTAATWIIHLHGLSLHLLWAWPRLANGSYLFDVVDSLPTLPQAVDGYARSLAYVNALGPEVVALVNAPRPVCILWSVSSSMQDKAYLSAQIDTFEALSFFGPQPLFIAEPGVDEVGVNTSCQVLVVPGQRYVSDKTVTAVERYVDQGGKVVVVGNSSVFNYNEAGVLRPPSSLEWLKNLTYIADQDPTKLLRALEPHLQPATAERIVTCVSATEKEAAVWGVLCRAARTSDGVVTALVNVLTVPVSLRLCDGNGNTISKAVDMYMTESVDLTEPLVMQSLDVRIFLIDE